jgi:hypothetical protein
MREVGYKRLAKSGRKHFMPCPEWPSGVIAANHVYPGGIFSKEAIGIEWFTAPLSPIEQMGF